MKKLLRKAISMITVAALGTAAFGSALTSNAYVETKTYLTGNNYDCIRYKSSGAEITITGFDVTEKVFTIPETLDDLPVVSVEADKYSINARYVEEIVIPQSVKTFSVDLSSTSLKTLEIPDNVKYIDKLRCNYLTTLESVMIGAGVSSIPSSCFKGCTALNMVQLPDDLYGIGGEAFFNTEIENKQSGVKYVGNWVTGCDNTVLDVVLKDGTIGIAEAAFRNCDKLERVTIPEGVTTLLANTFWNCTALTDMEMPESLTDIYTGVFHGCTALEHIKFSSKLRSINDNLKDTFYYKKQIGLKYATDNIIIGCDSDVTEIEIPEGVTKIASFAFEDAVDLEKITFPKTLKSIGSYAFNETAIYNNLPGKDKYLNGWLLASDEKSDNIKIQDGTIGLATAAVNSSVVKELRVPESVRYISTNAIMVTDCDIYIPENVEEIEDGAVQKESRNTIHGHASTAVKAYAIKYNINFVDLDTPSVVTGMVETKPINVIPDNKYTTVIAADATDNETTDINQGNLITKGDINDDGEFNIADMVMLQKYISKKIALTENKLKCADMNSDSQVNVFDVVIMKRKLIEKYAR